MAKKLKVGDAVRGYRITTVFGPGMMAIAYGAQTARGRKVFFKQYKSPAPTVVWYDEFVAYQKELSARVKTGNAAHFAVRQLDAFEETWGGPCYFQVYEFVENGADLQQVLDAEREQHRRTKSAPTRQPEVWARHVTWAKVLVAGVGALHEARVVHADLKPANAYLIEDPSIGSGYQLKLIDMDFSLLADRRAPWQGFQSYIGTDNYRSPEHLTKGAVPGPASDIFTCGLMMYELLAGEHPYWRDEQADYAALVRTYAAKPPALVAAMPAPATNAQVSDALHRCLSPDPAARPSAAELRAILSGRLPAGKGGPIAGPTVAAAAVRPSAAATPVRPSAAGAASGELIMTDGIELQAPDGKVLQVNVRTELGKSLLRQFGADSDFWDDRQCVVDRRSDRQWVVTSLPGTANETLLNGRALTSPHALRRGDQIAVGRQVKGVVKLPLVARGR